MALLEVDDLTVRLPTSRGAADAVYRVGFGLEAGRRLGIVGESGSGKSLTALAIMGLAPDAAVVTGRILFEGQDLVKASERALCAVRGGRIGMVFQEPMTALNPLHTVVRQVAEPLILHRGLAHGAARAEAVRLLERVGLPGAARADAYPHELSGGQRQRVTIAAALACGPALLLADEPTTALDATTQRAVLDLIVGAAADGGMALVLISHDLGLVAEAVDDVQVMYGGTIVESGPAAAVFARPAHPYTRGLLAARPRLGGGRRRLPTIPGTVPSLADLPGGCRFAGRCPLTIPACSDGLPAAVAVEPGHLARCIRLAAAAMLP